jgi:hypothetical protein
MVATPLMPMLSSPFPPVDVKGTDFYTRAAGNGFELMLRQFRNFYCLS